MAMTVTTSINGQSIGTSSNKGNKLFPQKVTANAASTKFGLSARVTNGAAGYDIAQAVTVHFGVAAFDVTAAVARQAAERDEVESTALLSRLMRDRNGFLAFHRETSALVSAIATTTGTVTGDRPEAYLPRDRRRAGRRAHRSPGAPTATRPARSAPARRGRARAPQNETGKLSPMLPG